MKKNDRAFHKRLSGFTLVEIVIGLAILLLALTPLFTVIMSQKDFGTITLKEIQATCYADELITQLYVYPTRFFKTGTFSASALSGNSTPVNRVYSITPFDPAAPKIFLTCMESGFERKMDIVYDPVLKLYKVHVFIDYDTVTLTGKPKRETLKANAIISDFL